MIFKIKVKCSKIKSYRIFIFFFYFINYFWKLQVVLDDKDYLNEFCYGSIINVWNMFVDKNEEG